MCLFNFIHFVFNMTTFKKLNNIKNKTFLLLTYFFLCSCASEPADALVAHTVVELEHDKIYYTGSFSKAANQKFFHLYHHARVKPTWLVIKSGGGEANLAMDLGDFIQQYELKVRIDQVCFSSCAHYILTSGKTVYIKSDAFVGFHGSVNHLKTIHVPEHILNTYNEAQKKTMQNNFNSYLEYTKKRERYFFNRRDIDIQLLDMGHRPQYQKKYAEKNNIGWFYTEESFIKLGVKNLIFSESFFQPKMKVDKKLFKIDLTQ